MQKSRKKTCRSIACGTSEKRVIRLFFGQSSADGFEQLDDQHAAEGQAGNGSHLSLRHIFTSFLDWAFYADLNGGGHRFLGKPAAAVISARRAGTTATWDQMNKYFGLMQMPIITSRYWNMVHGTTPEEVRQDLEGIQTLELLGHNMAYFLKCREAGEKLGIPAPPQRPFVYTNFIREESHA